MRKKLLTTLAVPLICLLFCVAVLPVSVNALPAGCPGTNTSGAPKGGSCGDIPAGCPGSGQKGPAKKGICGDIPAGCPGSSHEGKPKPQSECPFKAPSGGDNNGNGNGNNNGNNNGNGNGQAAVGGGGQAKAGKGCNGSDCDSTPTGQGKNCDDTDCDLIALYVNPFINLLSIIVGLVVVASLIMGGIQYTTSSGDPQKTSAAKSRIQNTLVAFLAYLFLYAFLNFLIPGGVFN